jgi:ABC-2 type transport system permease protein
MTPGSDGTSHQRPSPPPATPGWIVVTGQELRDLWLGGRGPILTLTFSLLLSVLTYLSAANKELNLLDQKDTVNLVMKITLGIGVALSLLVSADAISGERERGTLETLLLAPPPPRQIAIGKLLATLSVWPVMVLVAAPYAWVLRTGLGIFADAIAAGLLVGALLAVAFASLGIVVSTLSASNRISLAASFFVFIVLVAPSQLPGGVGKGWLGELVTRINPVTAGEQFLDRVIVSNHAWSQETGSLTAPLLAALVATTAAFLITGRLRLQGGIGG